MSGKFANGTQVLTKEGWIDIASLEQDSEILQYNQETEEFSFIKPLSISDNENRDSFLKISGKNEYALQVVTPEHKVCYEYRNSKGQWVTKSCEAKDLYVKIKQHGKSNVRIRTFGVLPEDFEDILGEKATRFISGEEIAIIEDFTPRSSFSLNVPTGYILTRFASKKKKDVTPVISGN